MTIVVECNVNSISNKVVLSHEVPRCPPTDHFYSLTRPLKCKLRTRCMFVFQTKQLCPSIERSLAGITLCRFLKFAFNLYVCFYWLWNLPLSCKPTVHVEIWVRLEISFWMKICPRLLKYPLREKHQIGQVFF